MTRHRSHEGFTLIELLIVIAIIGLIIGVGYPRYMDSLDKGRQRTAMLQIKSISDALEMYRTEKAVYPPNLVALEPKYMREIPPQDPWGNAYSYDLSGKTYTITSMGADLAAGPSPPSVWVDEPYEADIILADGQFIQAPGRRIR